MANVSWIKVKNQSLAKAVRQVGFDISIFDQYSDEIKAEVAKRAIKEVLKELSDAFYEETGKEFKKIKKGVYVICLSSPFVIQYPQGQSEIIYIGQGNVLSRLEKHFELTLFRLMQSLSGTNFDFYIAEPKMPGRGKAKFFYKHIEYLLLNRFKEKFGGDKKENRFPLLNENAGSNKKIITGKGWDKPLSRAGKRPQWALEITDFWSFEKLD